MAWTAATAQKSANARGEFGKGERLGDVIVGTGVQSADTVLERARSGHKHDR